MFRIGFYDNPNTGDGSVQDSEGVSKNGDKVVIVERDFSYWHPFRRGGVREVELIRRARWEMVNETGLIKLGAQSGVKERGGGIEKQIGR